MFSKSPDSLPIKCFVKNITKHNVDSETTELSSKCFSHCELSQISTSDTPEVDCQAKRDVSIKCWFLSGTVNLIM